MTGSKNTYCLCLSDSNSALRAVILSVAVAGILPSIETFGVAMTNLISASLAWIGFVYVDFLHPLDPSLDFFP